MKHVALEELVRDERNVRTRHTEKVAALKASIKAHGLLQPLVAVKNGSGYKVVAGGRRLLALQQLASEGEAMKKIPITVVKDKQAIEVSLAENLIRKNLTDIELYEAIATLGDEGDKLTQKEIAARFSQPIETVRRAQRLGRVHPIVRAAYADDEFDHACIEAFAATADQDAQLEVYEQLDRYWPQDIRRALGFGYDVKRALEYVGAAEYKKAGGAIEQDLFGSDLKVSDPGLLSRMEAEKKLAEDRELADQLGIEVIEDVHDSDWRMHHLPYKGTAEVEQRLDEIHELLGWPRPEGQTDEEREKLRDEESELVEQRQPWLPESDDYQFGIHDGRLWAKPKPKPEGDGQAGDAPKQVTISGRAEAELAKMRDERRVNALLLAGSDAATTERRLAFLYARRFYGDDLYCYTPNRPNKADAPELPEWITEADERKAYELFLDSTNQLFTCFCITAFADAAGRDSLIDDWCAQGGEPEWESSEDFWSLFHKKELLLERIAEFAPRLASAFVDSNAKIKDIRDYAHNLCMGKSQIANEKETAAAQAWIPAELRIVGEVE